MSLVKNSPERLRTVVVANPSQNALKLALRFSVYEGTILVYLSQIIMGKNNGVPCNSSEDHK